MRPPHTVAEANHNTVFTNHWLFVYLCFPDLREVGLGSVWCSGGSLGVLPLASLKCGILVSASLKFSVLQLALLKCGVVTGVGFVEV